MNRTEYRKAVRKSEVFERALNQYGQQPTQRKEEMLQKRDSKRYWRS